MFISIFTELEKRWILQNVQRLAESNRKYAIYGSGKAAEEILTMLHINALPLPEAVIDHVVPSHCPALPEIPVFTPEQASALNLDSVFVSSKRYENEIVERIRAVFPATIKTISISEKDMLLEKQVWENVTGAITTWTRTFKHVPSDHLKNGRIFHFGVGEMVPTDLLTFLFGVKQVFSLDMQMPKNFPDVTSYYHSLVQKIREWLEISSLPKSSGITPDNYERKLARGLIFAGDRILANCVRYQVYPACLESFPFKPESFDLIHSNAVLEHVVDPGTVIPILSSLMKPGAYAVHCIDFRDHIDSSSPYSHLSTSKGKWEQICRNSIKDGSYNKSNRCRYSDYVNIFEKNRMEIIHVETTIPDECIRKTFPDCISHEFSHYPLEELLMISATFWIRKK